MGIYFGGNKKRTYVYLHIKLMLYDFAKSIYFMCQMTTNQSWAIFLPN